MPSAGMPAIPQGTATALAILAPRLASHSAASAVQPVFGAQPRPDRCLLKTLSAASATKNSSFQNADCPSSEFLRLRAAQIKEALARLPGSARPSRDR